MTEKKSQEKKPELDDVSLEKRIGKLKKHLLKNKHDYKTKRTLQIKEAKLRKLRIYKERIKK